jgi:hypothetical protein
VATFKQAKVKNSDFALRFTKESNGAHHRIHRVYDVAACRYRKLDPTVVAGQRAGGNGETPPNSPLVDAAAAAN